MLPSGPESTAADTARYWQWCPVAQEQRPPRAEDAWSNGYGTPSPAPSDVLTTLARPQAVVAWEIGPLPDPIPTYGPFVVPTGGAQGAQSRSWVRGLFFIPGHPGWQPFYSLVLARLFDRTRGPAPPEGAVLNTGTTGPSWFRWPGPTGTWSEPTVTSEESD